MQQRQTKNAIPATRVTILSSNETSVDQWELFPFLTKRPNVRFTGL